MPGSPTFELVGARKVANDLRMLQERIASPTTLEVEFEILEEAEKIVFEQYGGKYVQTGATKDSLTQSSARGAIRRIHGAAIEFGTSIWYAQFQRKIGGPSGKPRGRKRVGPNLLLRFTPQIRQAAVKALAARIMGRVD